MIKIWLVVNQNLHLLVFDMQSYLMYEVASQHLKLNIVKAKRFQSTVDPTI